MTGRAVTLSRDPATLAEMVAGLFADEARAAAARRGRYLVALAGGSTPRLVYQELAKDRLRIDWRRVAVFWSDERCVPPDHPDSNYRMAREALLDHVPIPAERIHRTRGELDPGLAAVTLENEIAHEAGTPPVFDLVMLGLGDDGHTASLFPGSPALLEKTRTVLPVVGTKPPPRRITFTLVPINLAREVWVLVSGADKAATVAAALEGEPDRLPIQAVKLSNGTIRWLLDRAAGSRLREGPTL